MSWQIHSSAVWPLRGCWPFGLLARREFAALLTPSALLGGFAAGSREAIGSRVSGQQRANARQQPRRG